MASSPNYREDSLDGLDPTLAAYLDDHYLPTLENLGRNNPRLLVVFSGGNGVGKSTLAREITDQFGAVLIENDAIKRVLLVLNPAYTMNEMSPIAWKYTMSLYERLPQLTDNGLVVRDGTIAWYFERILPVFLEQGYDLFIVDYQLSEAKMAELIRTRGDTPTTTADRLLTILPEHLQHMQHFREKHAPDVVMDDTNVFDHERVIDALRDKLKTS